MSMHYGTSNVTEGISGHGPSFPSLGTLFLLTLHSVGNFEGRYACALTIELLME